MMSDLIERLKKIACCQGDCHETRVEAAAEIEHLTTELDLSNTALEDKCLEAKTKEERIAKLGAELDQAYGDIASIRDDKNAEIDRLSAEIRQLRKVLSYIYRRQSLPTCEFCLDSKERAEAALNVMDDPASGKQDHPNGGWPKYPDDFVYRTPEG